MKKYLIYYVSIILINTSCNRGAKSLQKNQILVNSNLKFEKNIFDIVDEVEILQLNKKGAADFSFNSVSKTVEYGNKYFFKSNNVIYKTTKRGALINTLSKQGIAPNEYREIKDFDINSKGELYIYDFQKQRFIIYDLNFKYLRTENIGFNFIAFKFITNDNLVLFTAKHRNKVNNKLYDFDILIVDKNFNILKKALPFDNNKFETTRIHNGRPFYKLNEFYLFNDLISDTIYSISDSIIKPYKTFVYSSKTFTKEYKNESHELILEELSKNSNKFKELDFFTTLKGVNKNIFIYNFSHGGKESIYSFYFKKTQRTINYRFPKETNSTEYKELFEIQLVDDDKFVAIVYPINLEFIKSQYVQNNHKEDDFTKKIDAIIENTEPDGNQVIIKYKIKEE